MNFVVVVLSFEIGFLRISKYKHITGGRSSTKKKEYIYIYKIKDMRGSEGVYV
jgi:hypothetical protein